jgi:hypothetical protein
MTSPYKIMAIVIKCRITSPMAIEEVSCHETTFSNELIVILINGYSAWYLMSSLIICPLIHYTSALLKTFLKKIAYKIHE